MGCTMGKAEKPAQRDDGGNHSNQKVAKETTKTKADDTPVITADNANTVKSEPTKVNGDVTSDANKNTCQNNSEDTADKPEGGVDPAAHGAKQEDRFYNNKSFQKPDVDPSDPSQQDAALKIQTKYRQHHAKQVVQEKREEKAAVKIQAGFRGHQDRQKVKSIKESASSEPVAEEEETKEEEEVDIDLNDPEVGAAATKIQAGFRGHKARKEIQEQKDKQQAEKVDEEKPAPEVAKEEDEEIDIDLNDPEVDKAASKIQAGFRGHQARKQVQAMKEQQVEENTGAEPQPEEPQPEGESEAPTEEPTNQDETETKAATKIQAGYRGFKTRKAVQAEKVETEKAAVTIQAGYKGFKTRKALNEQKEQEKAATKIQAGYRGFKARKEVATIKTEENEAAARIQAQFRGFQTRKELVQKKEEEDKAASRIQAGYRGHQVRKNMAGRNQEGQENEAPAEEAKQEEEVDIDLDDPEVQNAAVKIQAGFAGMKARKEVKAMKEANQPEEGGQSAPEEAEDKPAEEAQNKDTEEVDIDLEDPEVQAAATKIQAGFKGYKTRKQFQSKKDEDGGADDAQPE